MRWLRPSVVGMILVALPACGGPEYTRASDDPDIEDPAHSTRLDRKDLELMLDQWTQELDGSAFVATLPPRKPGIAILHIQNDTSEHIAGALDNLLSSAETHLVQSGRWNVVDNSTLTRDAVLAERLRDAGDAVDKETVAALGKEYGIEYFVNGRVGETTEKNEDVRRVQYYLFLRVTEVSTLRVMYQARADITKQEND
jgi:penicillin-binding protein activator